MFLRKHKKLIIFLVMLLMIAVSGLIGFLIAESEPRVVAETTDDETAVQAGTDNDRIVKETVMTWDYEYEMCKHHLYIDSEPDSDMIGMTFTQFKEKHPNVIIVSFSDDKVELKKRLECYCPEHFTLKRNKDKLAVYRTAVGTDKQDIYIDVDAPFDDFSKEQRDALEEGRVFGSIDDLQAYLGKINP